MSEQNMLNAEVSRIQEPEGADTKQFSLAYESLGNERLKIYPIECVGPVLNDILPVKAQAINSPDGLYTHPLRVAQDTYSGTIFVPGRDENSSLVWLHCQREGSITQDSIQDRLFSGEQIPVRILAARQHARNLREFNDAVRYVREGGLTRQEFKAITGIDYNPFAVAQHEVELSKPLAEVTEPDFPETKITYAPPPKEDEPEVKKDFPIGSAQTAVQTQEAPVKVNFYKSHRVAVKTTGALIGLLGLASCSGTPAETQELPQVLQPTAQSTAAETATDNPVLPTEEPSMQLTPTETAQPAHTPTSEINPTLQSGEVESVWAPPTIDQVNVKNDVYPLEEQSDDIKAYAVALDATNQIDVSSKEFRANDQAEHPRWTLEVRNKEGLIVWAKNPTSNQFMPYPILYGGPGDSISVLEEFNGDQLVYEGIPGSENAILIFGGPNGDRETLVRNIVTMNGEEYYSEYWNSSTNQWEPIKGIAADLVKINTEFEGIYSEKYYPDQYSESFVVKDKESELKIPISIGIGSGLPVTAVHLTELGKDYMGDYFLLACYNRYLETTQNNITYEEYIELVKQGEGQIQIDYFDEKTNNPKQGLYDPRNGVSITITYNQEMPLNSAPPGNSWEQYSYISVNKQGQLILSTDIDDKLLDIIKEGNQNQGDSYGYVYSFNFYTTFIGSMQYWSMLTSEHFNTGGLESVIGPRAKLFDANVRDKFHPYILSLNTKVDNKIPHMSVDVSN